MYFFLQVIRGNRNKGTVTRTTDFGRSPMSDIFGGKLRSHVHREGDHSTDNIQPFFTLQLDIEVSEPENVYDIYSFRSVKKSFWPNSCACVFFYSITLFSFAQKRETLPFVERAEHAFIFVGWIGVELFTMFRARVLTANRRVSMRSKHPFRIGEQFLNSLSM